MPPRILVVDDEPALCELLARMLRDEGYEVVKACDGLAGWDLVGRAAESFDLVVTDSRMPGMSGTEFIHRLREHNPTLPIVHFRAATSTPSTTSAACCLRARFRCGRTNNSS